MANVSVLLPPTVMYAYFGAISFFPDKFDYFPNAAPELSVLALVWAQSKGARAMHCTSPSKSSYLHNVTARYYRTPADESLRPIFV